MNILNKARQLETLLTRGFNNAAQMLDNGAPAEPLELVHSIVEALEDQIQPAGRGKHVFPFNRLKVFVVAESRESRARFEAVMEGDPSLTDRIVEHLHAAGCDTRDLLVKVHYISQRQSDWTRPQFHIDFARVSTTNATPAAPLPESCIHLAVVAGEADQPEYRFSHARIDLGRCSEVRDHRNRLIRMNHVAFADANGNLNETVSRRHAHIDYLQATGEYRVCDDGSAHGTGVLRRGRTIVVPTGARGIRLQSEDEIVLGEARLRVTIEARS
jgi:FHA domain-containing protein